MVEIRNITPRRDDKTINLSGILWRDLCPEYSAVDDKQYNIFTDICFNIFQFGDTNSFCDIMVSIYLYFNLN